MNIETVDLVQDKELIGFYAISISCEGFSALCTSLFFPLVIQTLAALNAFDSDGKPCQITEKYTCFVVIDNVWIETGAFVLYSVSLSVLIQFFLFITLGAMADTGSLRKKFLLFFGISSACVGSLMLIITHHSLYWLACIIFILSNSLYGAVWVFCYAYVPILVNNHPTVVQATIDANLGADIDIYKVVTDQGNVISSKGFMYGYIAAVVELLICGGFIFYTQDMVLEWKGLPPTYAMQITIAFVCIIQLIGLLIFTLPYLKTRPGRPLKTKNYLQHSLQTLGHTLSHFRSLSQLFTFLIGWFVYSDSFSTLITIAVLFAQSELGASPTLLLLGALMIPLAAGVGSVAWLFIQARLKYNCKQLLILQSCLYTVLPIWGLVGFFSHTFGIRNKYEMLGIAAYHGFLLGATQSTCRVFFSEMIPRGHEAEFFGLYEITDKGSAWIGPLVVAWITQMTGNIRYAFLFLLGSFLLSIWVFSTIDLEKSRLQKMDFKEKEE